MTADDNCQSHPFGSDTGATCVRLGDHGKNHVYMSAWAPDPLHADETGDQ